MGTQVDQIEDLNSPKEPPEEANDSIETMKTGMIFGRNFDL